MEERKKGGVQQLPKQRRVRETPEEVDLNVGKCISADTSLSYRLTGRDTSTALCNGLSDLAKLLISPAKSVISTCHINHGSS